MNNNNSTPKTITITLVILMLIAIAGICYSYSIKMTGVAMLLGENPATPMANAMREQSASNMQFTAGLTATISVLLGVASLLAIVWMNRSCVRSNKIA